MMIDWLKEVELRKEDLIRDTQEFLKIKSVLNEEEKNENAPFGKGIKEALEYALDTCEASGMNVKNLDGYAGHAEIGQGNEIIGILCHVDVVPEGDGWTTPPYAAEVRDGKIFARGAIDDKGPTMATIYAAKIVKDLNLNLNKRVRIIFGTDEESHWRGVHYYFEREEMPAMGFAPDADFPIIIAEKGIADITLEAKHQERVTSQKAFVQSFVSGKRPNMVPDLANVVIHGMAEQLEQIQSSFEQFLKEYPHHGDVSLNGENLIITLAGVSAHGMEPDKGVNAGLELIHFLMRVEQWLHIDPWMKWADQVLYRDYDGQKLGINYEDEITGALTVNSGILKMEKDKATITLNVRYPVTTLYEQMIRKIEGNGILWGITITNIDNSKPHHVDKNHSLVKTLQKVYKEQIGEEATLLSIGGGTYARALQVGVAFGPLFPGKVETAHQKDEYIEIEDLLKATAIYAQAIYELAK
ncbi:dipeptidase PepV [Tepidibacillus infernus]|uniref:dipeptidase PepV n=1 Tax=Tepidibacillus infernus TaxID=1806172 RepID=UPI003B74617E